MEWNRTQITVVVLAGILGFYFGSDDGVRYENPDVETLYRTLEVKNPYLPDSCKAAMLSSTEVLLKRDESNAEYDALINTCLADSKNVERMEDSPTSKVNAFNHYDVGDTDSDLTEEEVEEAFDECEIDYGDSEFCEDNLEDYLSRD